MLNQIRSLLQEDCEPVSGEFELDETTSVVKAKASVGVVLKAKRQYSGLQEGTARSQL